MGRYALTPEPDFGGQSNADVAETRHRHYRGDEPSLVAAADIATMRERLGRAVVPLHLALVIVLGIWPVVLLRGAASISTASTQGAQQMADNWMLVIGMFVSALIAVIFTAFLVFGIKSWRSGRGPVALIGGDLAVAMMATILLSTGWTVAAPALPTVALVGLTFALAALVATLLAPAPRRASAWRHN